MPLLFVTPELAPPSSPPKLCVRCNVPFVVTFVPCPDGREGCCVAHYGERCPKCKGDIYELAEISFAAWERP